MTPDEALSNANQSSGVWESEIGKHQVLSSDGLLPDANVAQSFLPDNRTIQTYIDGKKTWLSDGAAYQIHS